MKSQTPTKPHSDSALDDRPDDRHTPEPPVQPDKLGAHPGKGRTALRTGGGSDAEQLLDQQDLKRPT
ncbi:hypothetical protein [Herbaspirillum sp. YR522]|uniref:hypothetical protein n=1 Tax=Herbaspirillum sp. YR522 TaxID=1144342 RepID=UPI00026F7673|nr:hypothetical protein [Herbaspirillum sp. YR522]EJN08146.1 hypothetical protein PMI40_01439 [Herbaspirillum sp. YR522]